MTATIATGIIHDAHAARRSQPAAHPRQREWEALYQRQLARPHGSSPGARDANASTLALQSEARQAESQRTSRLDSDGAGMVAIAVGGHLELRAAGRVGSAATPGVGTDPAGTSGPGSPSTFSAQIGIGRATVPPHMAARTETASGQGSVGFAAGDAHLSAAAIASGSAFFQAVSGRGAVAPAATAAAPGGGPSDSQRSSRRSASVETPIDMSVAGTIALRDMVAVPGSGAGAMQQRDGAEEDPQDSSREALATDGASGRHYGTFPLIVSGELLELEFVALRAGEAQPASTAGRRIFLSMRPRGMGRVELTAQNLGDRVTVRLGGHAADCGAVAADVPALLQRLGWGACPVRFTVE